MADTALFMGRRKLMTDYLPASMIKPGREAPLLAAEGVASVIKAVWNDHELNASEIVYLLDYYRGKQDILNREKDIRPDINNKVVFNNAMAITRDIVGYTFGKPVRFAHRTNEARSGVEKLNQMVEAEDKFTSDQEIAQLSSICGTAYRGVFADTYGVEDEVPFSIVTLEPYLTFVVYSTEVGNPPVLAVTYYEVPPTPFASGKFMYLAYTKDMVYQYKTEGLAIGDLSASNLVSEQLNPLGMLPIVEYPNNRWRIGDWEMVKTLLDAINLVGSDCVNDLEGFVNSLLVGINVDLADISQEDLKARKILSFPSLKEMPSDIKYIGQLADAQTTEQLRKYLLEQMRIIVGLPSQDAGGISGGDTGDAVYLRNGYDRLETVARMKETFFKRGERTSLKLMLKIAQIYGELLGLKSVDVDIKFTRNLTDSILVKSNAISTLHATKILDPVDTLSLVGITTSPDELVTRGESYWKAHSDEPPQAPQADPATKQDAVIKDPKNKTKVDR